MDNNYPWENTTFNVNYYLPGKSLTIFLRRLHGGNDRLASLDSKGSFIRSDGSEMLTSASLSIPNVDLPDHAQSTCSARVDGHAY